VDFWYEIEFWYAEDGYVKREGVGQFHPSDASFKLEHMLWLMAEEFGRPSHIEVIMKFNGEIEDGKNTTKRLKAT